MTRSEAYFSPHRDYRYWLLRVWDDKLPLGCCIGVNPSIADEEINDPTVRKDIGFFTKLGLGGLLKLNVGAYRSTDPVKWRKAMDPIGRENSPEHLRYYIQKFNPVLIVAAWGKNGNYAKAQCAGIYCTIPDMMCLGKNPDGTPKHTLMLPYTTKLQSYHSHTLEAPCAVCERWAGL